MAHQDHLESGQAEENSHKEVLDGESRRHVAHQDHLESGQAEENSHKEVLDGESRRHVAHQDHLESEEAEENRYKKVLDGESRRRRSETPTRLRETIKIGLTEVQQVMTQWDQWCTRIVQTPTRVRGLGLFYCLILSGMEDQLRIKGLR